MNNGVEGSLQGVVFWNVFQPVFGALGCFKFQNGFHIALFIGQQGVPHTAEDGNVVEEITVGFVEIILPVHVRGRSQIVH